MKHIIKITLLLLVMFLVTQLIGLAVIDYHSPRTETVTIDNVTKNVTVVEEVPYGMQPPEVKPQISLISIIIALVIAIFLFFLLTRIRAALLIRIWFLIVVFIALAISLNALLSQIFPIAFGWDKIALILAVPLAFYKIIKRNLVVHNFTELLVYPGIAAIFVPILNIWTIAILLAVMCVYDMWAVWKSKFMIKMAKFQIKQLKIFAGFLIPYLTKGTLAQIKKFKELKGKAKAKFKEKKIKISLAALGGGDLAFPLMFAGVVLRQYSLISALIVVAAATLALSGLMIFGKKKPYPALPFITVGCVIGYGLAMLVS